MGSACPTTWLGRSPLTASVILGRLNAAGRPAEGRPASSPLTLTVSTFAPSCAFALAVVLLYSRDAVPFLYFQF